MNQSETEIEILAEKIARWARARSAEIERDRRLPDELVTRLRVVGRCISRLGSAILRC